MEINDQARFVERVQEAPDTVSFTIAPVAQARADLIGRIPDSNVACQGNQFFIIRCIALQDGAN